MANFDAQLAQIRQQFPILQQPVEDKPLIYFDNAATTQKPDCVIQAVSDYYAQTNANVHRASHRLSAVATQAFEQARETVAGFINARSTKEIIWTRGTTEGINLVANSFGSLLCAGDEILISSLEHHANIVPWQMLAERQNLKLRIIPLLENGELDLTAYAHLLNSKTKLVALTHASNALGTVNPIAEMITQAHAVGAKVLIDGAQAAAHFHIDIQALDADFYLFSGHKLFAPTGIGVLYAKEALLEVMPPWQGGGEMIKQVSFEATRFNQLPFKFEAGTPNIAGALGLATALNWLNQFDREMLLQHEQQLTRQALAGCSTIKGFRRIGQPIEHVSLLSFTLDQTHQQDIGILLDQQGIAVRTGHHCAMPLMSALGLEGTTRASFCFYNTAAEVDTFIQALEQLTQPVSVPSGPLTSVPLVSALNTEPAEITLFQRLLPLQDWQSRYREIMLSGKSAQGLAEYEKIDANLVPGCESRTWLSHQQIENRFEFAADSDARIMKGLLTLIIEQFNNKTAAEIRAVDIQHIFTTLALEKHLSPSRGNGIHAVVERIYTLLEQT